MVVHLATEFQYISVTDRIKGEIKVATVTVGE